MNNPKTRLHARAERVKEKCDLGALLQGYGYSVVSDSHREQQFSCDLHGTDNKPSARYYPASNQTYCWVCQKTRDPISWVREKEGLDFKSAVQFLEDHLGLDPLDWEDPSSEAVESPTSDTNARDWNDISHRVRKLLQELTDERFDTEFKLNAETLLKFWEAFDRVEYEVQKQTLSLSKGVEALRTIKEKIQKRLLA